jgi:hypothetical protein
MWPISPLNQALLIATALLTLALGASILHGRVLKAELGEKTAEIDYMRRVATEYSERSEQTARETSDAFTTLVEQIKGQDTALKNARAKFGSCNVAGGITAHGMLRAKDGVGEASLPSSPSESHLSESVAVSPDFINACAADAAFVGAVQQWRVANDLPVSKD